MSRRIQALQSQVVVRAAQECTRQFCHAMVQVLRRRTIASFFFSARFLFFAQAHRGRLPIMGRCGGEGCLRPPQPQGTTEGLVSSTGPT